MRNDVTRKRLPDKAAALPDCRGRIVNHDLLSGRVAKLGKVAPAHGLGRHGRDQRGRRALAQAFIGSEEERLIVTIVAQGAKETLRQHDGPIAETFCSLAAERL